MFSTADCVKSPVDLVRLWMHEGNRVYRDKLVEERDMEMYDKIQKDMTTKFFEVCLVILVLYSHNFKKQKPLAN